MSERPHFMQLEANEDATSVRDRLSFIRGQRVLLVWPEEGTVLTRKLDLVLIQREAMRRAIRLALVTHDPTVAKHAAELNISTFETIGDSERKRWKRGRSKVFANRYQKPDSELSPQELQEVASRVREEDLSDAPLGGAMRYGIVAALVLFSLALAYVIVPSADVVITPARSLEQISLTLTAATGATDIDIENGIIPLTQLRVEIVENGTLETTGTLALNDTRAAGSVVLINRTQGVVQVPAGTVLATSAGEPIQFRTTENVTIPAGTGEQVETPIEALQDYAGEIGNVAEGLINVVAGNLNGIVDVRNVTPTSGGNSQTASAVTQSDRDRLEATVRQQIQAQAFNEMQPLLNETQFIILETLAITEERNDWKTFSAEVGETTDTLSLQMRAIVQATAVDEQFGRQIIFANLSSMIPRGRVIQPDSIDYTRGTASELLPDGNVSFEMAARAIVEEPIDTATVQRRLTNRSPQSALEYLFNEIESQPGNLPQVTLSPSWMRRMPVLPMRIHVDIQEASL